MQASGRRKAAVVRVRGDPAEQEQAQASSSPTRQRTPPRVQAVGQVEEYDAHLPLAAPAASEAPRGSRTPPLRSSGRRALAAASGRFLPSRSRGRGRGRSRRRGWRRCWRRRQFLGAGFVGRSQTAVPHPRALTLLAAEEVMMDWVSAVASLRETLVLEPEECLPQSCRSRRQSRGQSRKPGLGLQPRLTGHLTTTYTESSNPVDWCLR
jgi:hypothetical protein